MIRRCRHRAETEYIFGTFATWVLACGGWLAPRSGSFSCGWGAVPFVQEVRWTLWPVWTGAENLASTGIRSPDRSARRESLYLLSYPFVIVDYGNMKKTQINCFFFCTALIFLEWSNGMERFYFRGPRTFLVSKKEIKGTVVLFWYPDLICRLRAWKLLIYLLWSLGISDSAATRYLGQCSY